MGGFCGGQGGGDDWGSDDDGGWWTYDEWWYGWLRDGECYNDLSSADSFGDDCRDYDHHRHWCGNYDTPDFRAGEQCCICQIDRSYVDYTIYITWGSGGEECEDDLSTADDWGDDCDDYRLHPGWCGNYDTDTFDSAAQCCICAGVGGYIEIVEECVDQCETVDTHGDNCDWYELPGNSVYCGYFDWEDFTAEE